MRLGILTLILMTSCHESNSLPDDLMKHSDKELFDSGIFSAGNAFKDGQSIPEENRDLAQGVEKRYGIGPHHRVSIF